MAQVFKGPLDQAIALQQEQVYTPFKLDKKKYPDVEETPYGFIYNAGGRSITDLKAQNKALGYPLFDKTDGFSVTIGGDEAYYPDFDSAYKAAKGIK